MAVIKILVAAAPVVLSRSADSTAKVVTTASGGFTSFSISGGFVGATVGGGVMTETSNGTTIQYRDDTATRVPITINQERHNALRSR